MAAQGDDEPRGIPGRRTARRLQRRGALQPHRIPGVRMLLPQRPYQLAHLLKDPVFLPLDLRGIDGALRRARLLPRHPPGCPAVGLVFTPFLFRKGAFDQAGSQSPENGDHEHILQDRLNTHLQHPVGLFRRVGVIPDFDGLTERPFADLAELARVNIPRGLILVVYVVIAAVRGDIHHDGRRSRPILLLHIFADFAYQYPEGHADTKQARRKQENVKPLLLPFLSHMIISL